jgi:hypothetical protein
MSKYKDFVEEYKVSSKFSDSKKFFSYPNLNSHFNSNSRYNLKKDNYYTAEPTEKNSESPTTLSPTMQTISPTTLSPTMQTISPTTLSPTMQTISPTSLSPTMQTISPTTYIYYTSSSCPSIKNSTTFIPTIKNENNYNYINNNDLIIALTIPFSVVFFASVLFTIYYYKCYLKHKKQKQREREKELDLNFGLTYVDDF